MGMIELTMGKYYHKDQINDNVTESGLTVWRGFKANIVNINYKLYLQIDVCSRILREESFLTTLKKQLENKLTQQAIVQKYKGSSVIMKYGNLKIYKIEDIDFKQNPESTFIT